MVCNFACTASELWFGLLSYDLLVTLRNPLSNLTNTWKYQVFVNSICIALSGILLGADGTCICGHFY